LKLRQPLGSAVVAGLFGEGREPLGDLSELILEELNVKEIRFTEDVGELVEYSLKPDGRLLGPKYGAQLPGMLEAVAALDAKVWAPRLEGGEPLVVTVDAETVQLETDEVSIETNAREGYRVSGEGDLLVGVDAVLTDELVQEGLARELVRRIQNLRKDADFQIEDKIITHYEGDADLTRVLQEFSEYVRQETLSLELKEGRGPEASYAGEFEIDGKSITFHILTAPTDN
jgi:isoleucyl-tRNA synthetase